MKRILGAQARHMFRSMRVRNYRLYFTGQAISLSGTWMQSVAQAWLVLRLSGSGTALGLVLAAQFAPVLLLGAMGGVVADRLDKQRTLVVTQLLAGLQALVLGLLVATGVVRLWMVYAMALGLGTVSALDNPTRQTFVLEMVGSDDLTNAVSLNSVLFNLARVVGPAVAGVLIATVGIAPCFFVNAASYGAVIGALLAMRRGELQTVSPQPRRKGQLREGLRYVWHTPELRTPLMMMAVVGTLAYEWQVVLPLLARFSFRGDAGTYGAMSSLMGAGAVVGGLATAARRHHEPVAMATASLVLGVVILLAAAAPSLGTELAALVVMGSVSITFLALANTTLQLTASPSMRGRVMALWTIAFLGSTPVGGPVVGWVAEHFGPRFGLGLGGLSALGAGLVGWVALRRVHPRPAGVGGATGGPAPEACLTGEVAVSAETAAAGA